MTVYLDTNVMVWAVFGILHVVALVWLFSIRVTLKEMSADRGRFSDFVSSDMEDMRNAVASHTSQLKWINSEFESFRTIEQSFEERLIELDQRLAE